MRAGAGSAEGFPAAVVFLVQLFQSCAEEEELAHEDQALEVFEGQVVQDLVEEAQDALVSRQGQQEVSCGGRVGGIIQVLLCKFLNLSGLHLQM
eukprot:CAMPEP_0168344370 /NCGR_PEP_ID=MMETSP0213-20121227/16775_2 /TAXON_ID=151035 /ORGANISM="Euplotes harpa, Strain FSP1.4" /LENGTH=93 /DNA_ID=CAMNT_0008352097 /DNA_START=910 /DNA_END=1191 /DNA_ORIENTATION=-